MSSSRQRIPYIPPELIHVVLQQEELERQDLARCCLVNRAWAEPARKWLYKAISVRLVQDFPRLGSEEDETTEQYYILAISALPLLRTLVSNASLGQLVHSFEIESETEGAPSLTPGKVWRLPPEVLTTLVGLCPRAKELAIDSSWLTGKCRVAVQPHCIKMESLRLNFVTPQVWRNLRYFKMLKTLSAYQISLDASSVPHQALLLSLTQLSISECNDITFDIIQSPRWQSLRFLQVPIDAVTDLQPSLFPALYHLEISGSCPYGPISSADFFADLPEATSLEIFEMDADAYTILALEEAYIGTTLPPSCRRVNLDGCLSLDALLAVTRRSESGHRIGELGLSTFTCEEPFWSEDNQELERDFLVAARALLESLNVELIWYK